MTRIEYISYMTILLPPSRREFGAKAFATCKQWRNSPKWKALYIRYYGQTPSEEKSRNGKVGKNGIIGNTFGAANYPHYTVNTREHGRKSAESVSNRYTRQDGITLARYVWEIGE